MSDRFCPRHGRASRPAEVPGLRCDCPDPEIVYLRASHQRLCEEYAELVDAVIEIVEPPPWPTSAERRAKVQRARDLIGMGALPEGASLTREGA